MSVALWRPDLIPPVEKLYPAILYQDRISTISPPAIKLPSRRTTSRGFGGYFAPSALGQFEYAYEFQQTLGDLYVPTQFEDLTNEDGLLDVLGEVVDAAAVLHANDSAVKEWRGYISRRKKAAADGQRRSNEAAPYRTDQAKITESIARLEREKLEAREDDDQYFALRLKLEELSGEIAQLEGQIESIEALVAGQNRSYKDERRLLLAPVQEELRELDRRIKDLRNAGDAIPGELQQERNKLQYRLMTEGRKHDQSHVRAPRESELEMLRDKVAVHAGVRDDLRRAMDARECELAGPFDVRLSELRTEWQRVDKQINAIVSSRAQVPGPYMGRGQWDFILEDKVGGKLGKFLVEKFDLPSETNRAGDEWYRTVWGPAVLLKEVLAFLADSFVRANRGSGAGEWFTIGQGDIGEGSATDPVGNPSNVSQVILQIGLPVPTPESCTLGALVDFRRSHADELDVARRAIEEHMEKIARAEDGHFDFVSELSKRLEEPLREVDTALKRHHSRLVVKAGAVLRNPRKLVDQVRNLSVPYVLKAGAVGLCTHDLVAAATQGKISQAGALGLAATVVADEIQNRSGRRAVSRSGLQYVYALGREFGG